MGAGLAHTGEMCLWMESPAGGAGGKPIDKEFPYNCFCFLSDTGAKFREEQGDSGAFEER